MEEFRLLWKTSPGRKFQRLTDFCPGICRLSFSVPYKCLPFLLVCPGGNNPEAAVRCCDKTFLRSHTTYKQTTQLIWESSLHILWSGPPLTFHCTGSAYVQWRIRGSGHENFSTPTTSLTSVEPPPADLAAPRQTLLGSVTPSLHSAHVQWGWRWHFNAASSLQCRCPPVMKHPGARYSSRCQQKRYDNACVHVTVNAEFKSESIL